MCAVDRYHKRVSGRRAWRAHIYIIPYTSMTQKIFSPNFSSVPFAPFFLRLRDSSPISLICVSLMITNHLHIYT